MKKRSAILIVAIALPSLLILYSCNKSKEKPIVIVDWLQIDKDGNFETVYSSVIAEMLFSPILYVYNSRASIHYVLAEQVDVKPGNKVIELKLKSGVRFHDGTPLTAEDVILSIERLKADNKNFKKIRGTVIDRDHIRLQSDSPIYDVNGLLGSITVLPPSKASLFTGTGPYKFAKWRGNGIELEANEDYFEGPPKVKNVVYLYEPDERKRVAMLLKGEADLMAGISPDMARFLKKDGRFKVHEDYTSFYTALFFNTKSSLLSDKIIRKAVSMSIDRNAVIKQGVNGGGIAISTPFPIDILPVRESPSQNYRPKEASRMLREAGWKDSDGDGILEKNGRKLSLNIYYSTELGELQKIADILTQQLYEVGIGLHANKFKKDEFRYVPINYDGFLWTVAYADIFNLDRWLSSSPANENKSRYVNDEIDRIVEKLRKTDTEEKKKMIYGRIQEIFNEDVPAAFLYANVCHTAVSRQIKTPDVLGFNVYSFYKIKDWETERR